MNKKDRTGEERIMNCGQRAKIIKYRSATDIDIEFEEGEDFYKWGHMGNENRVPNGTIIRESLKMVGRMANIAANNVCLSPYNNCIFKE